MKTKSKLDKIEGEADTVQVQRCLTDAMTSYTGAHCGHAHGAGSASPPSSARRTNEDERARGLARGSWSCLRCFCFFRKTFCFSRFRHATRKDGPLSTQGDCFLGPARTWRSHTQNYEYALRELARPPAHAHSARASHARGRARQHTRRNTLARGARIDTTRRCGSEQTARERTS